MSNDKVIVEFEMIDAKKTVDSIDQGVKRTNKSLERTQELMKGTKGGSKAAGAAFGRTEYDTARGTTGTGAGGRDFAKQSRELDGLVRLYAVYAANIFAAGAAFRALSEAMDTTNMIEGLNQLGAASGVAMGGLAKRFADASGGAISLRESMEATAKAVSSGLSQAQFLKLGEVAKKASQALGVNMSDAVSRLTRGITKLEPELLDELGIFTKVGQATEDYARAIGKPAAALTDFEKRQAFANAVLAEGAKKFGQIDIPTNPYDKLLATLKNVAQAGLEIVNNVLGPFANLLAKNSGLLVGVLGLIGAKIVKDALPAIGQWRAGLKEAADEAKKRSSDIAASFGESFVERTNAAFKIPDLESNLKKSEQAYRESRAKMAAMDTDLSKKLLKGGIGTDDKSLKAEQTRYTKEINALKRQGLETDKQTILALEKERAVIIALRGDMKALGSAQDAALNKGVKGTVGEQIGDWARSSAAKGARERSQRLEAISNVSTVQREQGFSPAIAGLLKDLDGIPGRINKVRTGIAGVVVASAGAIGTVIAGLSRFFAPVAIILGIVQTMAAIFRSNEVEAEKFSSSLGLLADSSENAYRVLERLSKLDPLERMSLESLNAKATALDGLGTSLTQALNDFEREVKSRNIADSVTNFLFGLIGRSSEDLLAKNVVNSVERAIKLAGTSDRANKLREDLASLVSLPADASAEAIANGLKYAGPKIKEQAAKLIDTAGKEATRSTGSFKTFNESLVESGKLYQDLQNTFKSSSPLSKFAEDSSKKILELGKSLDTANLEERLAELARLSNDQTFLQLFPTDAAKSILSTSIELQKLRTEYSNLDAEINKTTDALSAQQAIASQSGYNPLSIFGKPADLQKAEAEIARLKALKDDLYKKQGDIGQGLDSASRSFASAMRDGLVANIKTFTEGLRDAAARAGLELKKTASEGIVDARLKARVETGIEMKTLDLDRTLLQTQKGLIDSNAQLKLAIMENTYAINIGKPGVIKPGETEDQALQRPENKALLVQKNALTTFRDNMNKDMAEISAKIADQKRNRGGVDSATIQGLGEALSTAQARAELESKFAQLAGKTKSAEMKGKFAEIEADKTERLKSIQAAEKDIETKRQALDQQKASMGDDDYQVALSALTIDKASYAYQTKIVEANSTLLKAKASALGLSKEEAATNISAAQKILDTTQRQAEAEYNLAESGATIATNAATALVAFDRTEHLRSNTAKVAADQLDLDISMNQAAQRALDISYQQGFVDENSYKLQQDILKIQEAKLDQTKQLTAANEAATQALASLDRAKLAATGGTGELTGSAKAADEAERKRILDNLALQTAGIKSVTDARIRDAQAIADVSLRQTAYTDLFKQAFKGMEDAIVNFTKTGKLSFKDMINSFIEGLLRYEIQQQQIALFSGMGGAGGLAKMFMGYMGFGKTGVENPSGATGADMSLFYSAKGSVYDTGLTTFAKGGMFTNSIVNSPTMFKFAQGTGMMGEAGPEAIMPLKRDRNGNLGVRAGNGGGNVDVVVNNYGSEKATTKETTDSRGNRKIEVIIGDMVAGELNRPGSNVQQAMTASYGSTPLVARR